MALFNHQWGYPAWVDEDELMDGVEAIDLHDRESWEVAEDGDLPVGRDPLEILLALEALQE